LQNPGEELVGEYLKIIKHCDFVEYNLYTPDVQGEIDVVGINAAKKILYVCEVATHLITGLRYNNSQRQPDNVNRFIKKFSKNIEYADKYFPEYEKHFQLWSPIVKDSREGSKHNQMRDIADIVDAMMEKFSVEIEPVINQAYYDCLMRLREYAATETKELKSPLLRLLQIEEKLKVHISKI